MGREACCRLDRCNPVVVCLRAHFDAAKRRSRCSRGGVGQALGLFHVHWPMAADLEDLGRLASDLLLFYTQEFAFVKLPDAFTTGSSIMPCRPPLRATGPSSALRR